MRRRCLLNLIATAVMALALVVPSAAQATPSSFAPCLFVIANLQCATVPVPIDRSGSVPGDTRIQVVESNATEGPRRGTMVFLAGGPGQSSSPFISELPLLFDGAERYDIVTMDQRGTGLSEVLRCPRLENSLNLQLGAKFDQIAGVCANQLGPARASYTTAESVED